MRARERSATLKMRYVQEPLARKIDRHFRKPAAKQLRSRPSDPKWRQPHQLETEVHLGK